MKKLLILSICAIFTTPLFSFDESIIEVSPCSDYCNGVADQAESDSGTNWDTRVWLAYRNDCMDNSAYCQQ